jgi:hypothetical protein
MPVPVADGIDGLSFEEALERLHLLPASKLRPQFENAFKKVVEHLQNSFELKMINNNKMNGPILVEYMKNIVESINKNEQIFLMDTLNSSLKFIASESLKKAEHEYELEMNEYIQIMQTIHNTFQNLYQFLFYNKVRLLELNII